MWRNQNMLNFLVGNDPDKIPGVPPICEKSIGEDWDCEPLVFESDDHLIVYEYLVKLNLIQMKK